MHVLGLVLVAVVLMVAYMKLKRGAGNASHALRNEKPRDMSVSTPVSGASDHAYITISHPRKINSTRPVLADLTTPYLCPEDLKERRQPWPDGTNPYGVEIEFVAN